MDLSNMYLTSQVMPVLLGCSSPWLSAGLSGITCQSLLVPSLVCLLAVWSGCCYGCPYPTDRLQIPCLRLQLVVPALAAWWRTGSCATTEVTEPRLHRSAHHDVLNYCCQLQSKTVTWCPSTGWERQLYVTEDRHNSDPYAAKETWNGTAHM